MDERLIDFLGNEKTPIEADSDLYIGPLTFEGVLYIEAEFDQSVSYVLDEWAARFSESGGLDVSADFLMRVTSCLVMQFDTEEQRDSYLDKEKLKARLKEIRSRLPRIMKMNLIQRYVMMINRALRLPDPEDVVPDFPEDSIQKGKGISTVGGKEKKKKAK